MGRVSREVSGGYRGARGQGAFGGAGGDEWGVRDGIEGGGGWGCEEDGGLRVARGDLGEWGLAAD